MTIAENPRFADFQENGSTDEWPLAFKFIDAADIRAQRTAADGTVTALVSGVDFTVTGGSTDAGGTLTTTVAAAAGVTLNVWSETGRSQTADYATGDTFPAETHEARLDNLAAVDQEQDRELARAVQVPRGEEGLALPLAATRASKSLGFDAAGDPLMFDNDAVIVTELAAQVTTDAAQVGVDAAQVASDRVVVTQYYDAVLAAVANGEVFADTTIAAAITAGLAAVADQATFTATGDDVTYVGLYRDNAGSEVELARLPKQTALDAALAALAQATADAGTAEKEAATFLARFELLKEERPGALQMGWLADLRRGLYFNPNDGNLPEYQSYDDFLVPRLPEPTGNGLAIPQASANIAYCGLSEEDFEGFLDNSDLTTVIVNVADLPESERLQFEARDAAGTAGHRKTERVFVTTNSSGSSQNLQGIAPSGLSGTHTTSGWVLARAGNCMMRNSGTNSANGTVDVLERLSATSTGTAPVLRLTDGASCVHDGMMLEAGGSLSPYQEGFQLLNRVEPRNLDIKPNGIVLVSARFSKIGVGGETLVSLGSDDRAVNIRLNVNWPGGALTLSARDGSGNADINNLNAGGMSFVIGRTYLFAFEYRSDGQLFFVETGGVLRDATVDNDGNPVVVNTLDLSSLSTLRIGGLIPNSSTAAGSSPFNISPISDDAADPAFVDMVGYFGWDD